MLFTPAQYDALPGMAFPAEPDTYPTKDNVAEYLAAFAAAFALPVRLHTVVTSVRQDGSGYLVDTDQATFTAANVVVATGPFQQPVVPPVAAGLGAEVTQLHSSDYRNPSQLPDGRCWSSAAATPAVRSPPTWSPPVGCTSPSVNGCRRSPSAS